jgi:hypothetical protein
MTTENDFIHLNFDSFDLKSYELFLKSKKLPEFDLAYDWETDSYKLTTSARFASILGLANGNGVNRGWLPFSPHLKDFQVYGARVGLDARRFAFWYTTGLGKTHCQWELARQIVHRTQGKVLLIVPLNIIPQTLEIGLEYFGLSAIEIESRAHLKEWCTDGGPGIAIVNPEKFIPPAGEDQSISEIKHCRGILLDEASLLAAGAGVIKWALIHSCKGIEYKYTFTATPARNDTLDYASQASFLEKIRHEGEVLWTYFQRDKEGKWKIKKHAEAAFYRFLSGWSMYLVNPVRYGFENYLEGLPDPVLIEHKIALTTEQRNLITSRPDARGQLSLMGNREKLTLVDRSEYGQIAKGFMYGKNGADTRFIPSRKPEYVCNLIKEDASQGLQPLVWTVFDEESRILESLLKNTSLNVQVLHGKIPKAKRPAIIETYRKGRCDVLISKAELLGFGLNFQNCGSMIFSGFDDSFEKQFQAVRRAYRYGQKRAVKIHIPYIPELEGVVWRNVQRKQAAYERDTKIMEANYIKNMKGLVHAS